MRLGEFAVIEAGPPWTNVEDDDLLPGSPWTEPIGVARAEECDGGTPEAGGDMARGAIVAKQEIHPAEQVHQLTHGKVRDKRIGEFLKGRCRARE